MPSLKPSSILILQLRKWAPIQIQILHATLVPASKSTGARRASKSSLECPISSNFFDNVPGILIYTYVRESQGVLGRPNEGRNAAPRARGNRCFLCLPATSSSSCVSFLTHGIPYVRDFDVYDTCRESYSYRETRERASAATTME